MPKTSSRTVAPVDVTVSAPAEPEADLGLPRLPYVPWIAAAVVGSAAVVLLGWVLVGALVAAAWLSATHLAPAVVLDTVGQGWLAVHGSRVTLGGTTIGVTPLGLSALLAVAMGVVGRGAVQQYGEDARRSAGAVVLVASVCTGSYAVAAWLVASLVGAPRQAVAVFVGGLVIAGVGSAVGAARAARLDLVGGLPRWTRALLPGIAAGLVGLTLASVITLGIAVGAHHRQIGALHGGLAPDAAGSALLVVAYAAYLPNLLLWAGSYALGAGLTVGSGTLLTPSVSVSGLVPALPIAGALPAVPPAFGWLFLASGPVAGIAAAVACSGRLRRLGLPARPGRWAAVAGAAGLVSGAVWALGSWLARGDLGTVRLVGLGPRFPELLLAVLPVAGVAALGGTAFAWWVARRPASEDTTAPFGLADAGDQATPSPFGLA
nr:hypothetical protein [Propionibacterium sp.]